MKISIYKFSLITIIFMLSSFLSCEIKVPIKEMSLAKMEIQRAMSVKAEKYAPKEIKEAQDKLYKSHEELKNDKTDEAKKSADDSHKKAIEAYNISIPLLAKDTMAIAEKSLEDAEEAYAEVLARSEYTKAKNIMKKSQDEFESKKFYEAYISSIEADKEAKNARNIALGKKSTLSNSISQVNYTLAQAKKYNAEKYAPEKVKLAEENLQIASNAHRDLKLKEGFSAIAIAKINADDAYLMALRETSKEKIADAELIIEKAEKSEGAKGSKDELDGAKEAIKNAKAYLSDSKYKDSISASEEAKRLAYIVINTKPVAKDDTNKDVNKDVKDGEDNGDKDYITYKVKYIPGNRDCLWKISKKVYRNPYIWKKIYEANKDKINNPNLIFPGTILKVPIEKKSGNKDIKKKEDEAVTDENKDENKDEEEEETSE